MNNPPTRTSLWRRASLAVFAATMVLVGSWISYGVGAGYLISFLQRHD